MRDRWFANNRDLVKWGILIRLAEKFDVQRIVQLAFYHPSKFGQLVIDGQKCDIPDEVLGFFRNLQTVGGMSSSVRITVFDTVFDDRKTYLQAILALLEAFAQEQCIVFLDPDIGLQPKKPKLEHVLDEEANAVWNAMKEGDVFAFYQHQTNRAGQPWIKPKRNQLAEALGVQPDAVKTATAQDIPKDVAIYFAQKTCRS